jgi:hypothetical protein
MSIHTDHELLERLISLAGESNKLQGRVIHDLRRILKLLTRQPVTIRICYHSIEGEPITMPATINVGQTIIATPTELDAAGAAFTIVPANIQWSSSDTAGAIATMTVNPDGTATFVGVAPGSVSVGVSDTAYSLTASDTLTVNAVPPPPDKPASISISWGTPTP